VHELKSLSVAAKVYPTTKGYWEVSALAAPTRRIPDEFPTTSLAAFSS